MTETTFKRLVQQLISEIMHHPHKDEITALAQEQLADDTIVLVTQHP